MNNRHEQAMSFACRMLACRRRTTYEIRKKLLEKGFSSEVTFNVIDTLTHYGYLDDKAYARLWIEQRICKRGFAGLKYELQQKGINPNIIDDMLKETGPEAEFKAAFQLALKKLAQNKGSFPLPRLVHFLQNRGYSYDTITKVSRTIAGSNTFP